MDTFVKIGEYILFMAARTPVDLGEMKSAVFTRVVSYSCDVLHGTGSWTAVRSSTVVPVYHPQSDFLSHLKR